MTPRKEAKKEYVCPMHPEVISEKVGHCPECGTDLTLKVHKKTVSTHVHQHKPNLNTKTTKEQALCPVMEGTPVDIKEAEILGRVRDYKGKKYYLCCDSCVTDFDQNPKDFVG